MKGFTFNDLCAMLESDSSEKNSSLSENAEAIKTLIGSAAVLLGDTATGNVAGFIRAVSEKEKLIDLGRIVLQKILDKKPVNYVTKFDQMKEAYGLIYFTAFFDSLDHELPDDIRSSINLSLKEKEAIFQESAAVESDAAEMRTREDKKRLYSRSDKKSKAFNASILLPDIVYSSSEVDQELQIMYERMAGILLRFVEQLSFEEFAEEKEIRIFREVIEALPQSALKQFHEQYLYLCSHFKEFYVFARLEREKEQEIKSAEQYRTLSSLLGGVGDKIDIGFEKLKELITALPDMKKAEDTKDIAENLTKTYCSSLEKPVVDSQDNDEKLVYPHVSEAYIPQTYKLLRYTGQERLELTNTWNGLEPQKDMTSFWTKYYLDPASVENILLILGEPGIGKSLLTKVLCARMSSDTGVFIRIPLREHDMEERIESIVLSQLRWDGHPSVDIPSFKWFAAEFPDNPITVVFDGYDEVLQATGGVYRKLLKEIHNFQKECYEQSIPVRVIVTSRETLIDKADIPSESLVMKLLEFDDDQKAAWIDIWNEHNHDILSEEGLEDFRLPENNTDIEKLSGQPLLLLMLAIYDADFERKINSLTEQSGQERGFNRPMLYDELLRRFVRRELRKGPKGGESAFDESDDHEQEMMVNEEMKKLGIAALGMFVREKLFLTADELDHDLEYMEVQSALNSRPDRRLLKKAEIVFGSFFFIHHSEMENEEDKKDATYEFLHKTFYEFLAADLVLFYLIEAADNMYLCLSDQNRRRGDRLYLENMEKAGSFSQQYYASLNGACLYTEPEIIRMIVEWKDAKIAACTPKEPKFQSELSKIMKDIFKQHALMIRDYTFAPSTPGWCNGILTGDRFGKSFPESCAVYLINLLTLRILISGECEVGAELWNFVSQYFKLNAPLSKKTELENLKSRARVPNLEIPASEEMILKFMALFEIRREKNSIIFTQKQNDSINVQNNLLDARAEVFGFLQDDTSRMVYELHNDDTPTDVKQKYRENLIMKGADLEFELDVQSLKPINVSDYWHASYTRFLGRKIVKCIKGIYMHHCDENLVLDCLLCIREILDNIPESQLEILQEEIFNSVKQKYWKEYIISIIRVYTTDIVYVLLNIVKKIGHAGKMIGAENISEIIINPNIYSPDLVCKIMESISDLDHLNTYSSDFIKGVFDSWFYLHKNGSPKQLATVFEIFGIYFCYQIPDYYFNEICKRWSGYLVTAPKELPELFRIYLKLGKFDEVREFYMHAGSKMADCLIKKEDYTLIEEFLEIAEQVCVGRGDLTGLLKKKTRYIYINSPRTLMRELYDAISGNVDPEYIEFLEIAFLQLYERCMSRHISESVMLLHYLVKSHSIEEILYAKEFYRPCSYNLNHYRLILEESVNAAAHALQIWFDVRRIIQKNESSIRLISMAYIKLYERDPKSRDGDIDLSFYTQKCFDKALLNRKPEDVNVLIELLNSMDPDTKSELQNYFKKRLFYFKKYSEKLAGVINQMYD